MTHFQEAPSNPGLSAIGTDSNGYSKQAVFSSYALDFFHIWISQC